MLALLIDTEQIKGVHAKMEQLVVANCLLASTLKSQVKRSQFAKENLDPFDGRQCTLLLMSRTSSKPVLIMDSRALER